MHIMLNNDHYDATGCNGLQQVNCVVVIRPHYDFEYRVAESISLAELNNVADEAPQAIEYN